DADRLVSLVLVDCLVPVGGGILHPPEKRIAFSCAGICRRCLFRRWGVVASLFCLPHGDDPGSVHAFGVVAAPGKPRTPVTVVAECRMLRCRDAVADRDVDDPHVAETPLGSDLFLRLYPTKFFQLGAGWRGLPQGDARHGISAPRSLDLVVGQCRVAPDPDGAVGTLGGVPPPAWAHELVVAGVAFGDGLGHPLGLPS